MKLVSGGSSTVNASIHVSRSEVGWLVNLVLSSKNRKKPNQWSQNLHFFSILFHFRHDWKNAYACDFLLQMSEEWQCWTQCLVKCTESVMIETSMSNTYLTFGQSKWPSGCSLNVQQQNPTLSSWCVNVWPLSRQNSLAKLQHRKSLSEDDCKAGFLMILTQMWHKTLDFTL